MSLRPVVLLAATCLAASLGASGVFRVAAQEKPREPGLRGPVAADAPASDPTAEKRKRQAELEAVEQAIRDNTTERQRLDQDIESIRGDRAKLNTDLMATADRMRDFEQRMSAIEQRLGGLQSSEAAIRQSLQARRGLIGEVLAALQRMGRKPPPAIFVRPEDILEAVRASIALGAVLPDLRAETQQLAQDLGELVRLKDAISLERTRIAGEVEGLAKERVRLSALVDARQATLKAREQSASEESRKAADLARQAGTLRELLQKIESDTLAQARQSDDARRAEEARLREQQGRLASLAMRDPARLAPKIAFADARGTLQKPVEGAILRGFGLADDTGAPSRGQSIETRPGALVTAPSDGWIVFAGPFRSFGRLLIVNAGGGYYIVLAGMERVTVDPGQFVLAGEPIAAMGAGGGAASAEEGKQPVLYVEFRKDGASIDPSPWWARADNGKVRG
ncbi:murein hydrolase activator EnvC family protein [Terrarubrum flagellatum]|uniref:murein hydrolase activator EnvC family protein n=1 Tax=Terrirubrum flagellatum TaxID=2895980 RepID=UPI003144DEE3